MVAAAAATNSQCIWNCGRHRKPRYHQPLGHVRQRDGRRRGRSRRSSVRGQHRDRQ
jgi:hypothetical protein